MCGICGVVALDQRSDVGPQVDRLMDALSHRGPDGAGMRSLGGRHAVLGHRRLSIVDLVTGAQPMENEDASVWVTYNGEIYNHRALRTELERLGHRFRTQADTEVLVHGFEAWGPSLFPRLNGIFAFALFDGQSPGGAIWLVRDPVGAKPLYVGGNTERWWFASELAAARNAGLVSEDLRAEAIEEFLVYRFIPSPGTPFRSVWKVPPGHYCRVPMNEPLDTPQFHPYESAFTPASIPGAAGEWQEALQGGLEGAVRRQLMADVPVGSLLSGGVDSTVVTRLMREHLAQPPQAFAIGFGSRDGLDELRSARAAAAALDVPLVEVQADERQYREQWLSSSTPFGEPVANTGMLLVAMLCRRVRETHKVVLSGQGADEPLGGYPRHAVERWYPVLRRLRWVLQAVPERWAESDRVTRTRRVVAEPERARRFAEILAVFSPAEVEQLTGRKCADRLTHPVQRWLSRADRDDPVNALLYVDARLSLADDLLLIADRMSMAFSVELRVPFLDLELLALLERMPSRYKLAWTGARKWLYRRAIRGGVPAELRAELLGWAARTGRKLGFTTPLSRWADGWSGDAALEFLTGRDAVVPQFVSVERVRDFLRATRGRARERQLAALFVLETWLRGVHDGRHPRIGVGALAL
ncbi:MAG TPA: asparagine synthase (glutamine-hydrolyzing) [Gemmatimonadales bacterium]|nr:asparagine synthase (glutamine-hydrolyzing) [Gemmatimonadales bacterium]